MSEPSFATYDLLATGTRYEHYQELKEVFAIGVEILTNTGKSYQSPLDDEKRLKLKHAVEMIERRLEMLSGMQQKTAWGSELRTTIDAISRNKGLLTEGSNVRCEGQADGVGNSAEENSEGEATIT